MPYKNARIHLRVTDEEKQSIIEKAAQARQSVSQYILSLSENKTIIVVDGADEVTRQLLKIGNNINQIAVVANTSRKNECELPSYYLNRSRFDGSTCLHNKSCKNIRGFKNKLFGK